MNRFIWVILLIPSIALAQKPSGWQNEVQRLDGEQAVQDARIDALEAEQAVQGARVDALEALVTDLEARVSALEPQSCPTSTAVIAGNGEVLACGAVVNPDGSFSFEFDGYTLNVSSLGFPFTTGWLQYSELNCAGTTFIYDPGGLGIDGVYGVQPDADIWVRGGAMTAGLRRSKTLFANDAYLCSNDSLGSISPWYIARRLLDGTQYPWPYTVVSQP